MLQNHFSCTWGESFWPFLASMFWVLHALTVVGGFFIPWSLSRGSLHIRKLAPHNRCCFWKALISSGQNIMVFIKKKKIRQKTSNKKQHFLLKKIHKKLFSCEAFHPLGVHQNKVMFILRWILMSTKGMEGWEIKIYGLSPQAFQCGLLYLLFITLHTNQKRKFELKLLEVMLKPGWKSKGNKLIASSEIKSIYIYVRVKSLI